MRYKKIILLCSIFFVFASGNAQDSKAISLKDAVQLSISNSKQLKLNLAKIEEAMAAVKEAMEKKLPNAGVAGSYLRLNSAHVELKNQNNNSGNGSGEDAPKLSQAIYGTLNVTLPIYSGGRIKYGIESTKFLAEAIKLDAEADKDAIIQNTIEAFANLFKAKNAVGLIQENLNVAKKRVTNLANLEKNGMLAKNDLLKAGLQSSQMELNLLDATNNLQLANLQMDIILGLPINTELVLDTSGIEKRDDGSKVLADYIEAAQHNRKDVLALGYRKKAAESNLQIAKGEQYPSLQLTGGYIAANIPHFLTVTNAVNVGVGVSYNIASLWKSKSKIQQASSRSKQVIVTEAILNDKVTLQVSSAYLNLQSSRKKLK